MLVLASTLNTHKNLYQDISRLPVAFLQQSDSFYDFID